MELVNNDTLYTIGLLDYEANGGDGYTIFKESSQVINTGNTLYQVMMVVVMVK